MKKLLDLCILARGVTSSVLMADVRERVETKFKFGRIHMRFGNNKKERQSWINQVDCMSNVWQKNVFGIFERNRESVWCNNFRVGRWRAGAFPFGAFSNRVAADPYGRKSVIDVPWA